MAKMAQKMTKWSYKRQYPSMWGNKRLFASSKLFHFPKMKCTEGFWGLRLVFRSLEGLSATKLAIIGQKRPKWPTELSFLSCRRIQRLLHGPSTTLCSLTRVHSIFNEAGKRNEERIETEIYHLNFESRVIDKVTKHRSVFTRGDLVCATKCIST